MILSRANFNIGIASIVVVLLACMLAFPFGYDQSVFAVGGEAVLKVGAFPGRDILDTKPPIIFFIYSLSSVIFGHHQWSIRALDIIYHLVTLTYFYAILKRVIGDEKKCAATIALYTLFYVTSGYWMTAQAESFAFLPSIIIFDLAIRFESKECDTKFLFLSSGLTAACLFILILLKYTISFELLGLIGFFLFNYRKSLRKNLIYIASTAFFLFLFSSIYLLFLRSTGSLEDLILGAHWVSDYAAINPIFGIRTIKYQFFLGFPQSVISTLTPAVFLLIFLGIWYRNRQGDSGSEKTPSTDQMCYSYLLWQLSFGLLSIMAERKNFAYQYARILWALVPFLMIGLVEADRVFRKHWKEKANSQPYRKIPAVILVCTALFFSPITRLLSQPISWSLIALTNNEQAKLEKLSLDGYRVREMDSLVVRLRAGLAEHDNVLFWGNTVEFYYDLDKIPKTICLTNTPLITPWTPIEWKNKFLRQLYSTSPLMIVCEIGDGRPEINGTNIDSYEAFLHWREFYGFVENHYYEIPGSSHFKVFLRRN